MKEETDTQMPPNKGFHVMLKPRGPICNLDCKYCYYLRKERQYPGGDFKMSPHVLEKFIQQYIEAQSGLPEITFAWQGGEPTLRGIEFFRDAVRWQKQYAPAGTKISNTFQTNGTRLDDEWCELFKENEFLIGISIDGPQHIHDAYRLTKGGEGSFDKVMKGLESLNRHQIEHNILTTVHAANQDYGAEVYRFIRDTLGETYFQFIPIVERSCEFHAEDCSNVVNHSVTSEGYGRFLIRVFDEWIQKDLGHRYVQIIESALAAHLGHSAGLCVFEETCGRGLAMEHNGDLYSCDHFVEPAFKVGNLGESSLLDMVNAPEQIRFGNDKRDQLPDYCKQCSVKYICNGGCPKNRFIQTPTGKPGLNYLCKGYKAFFQRIQVPLNIIAQTLSSGHPAEAARPYLTRYMNSLSHAYAKAGRNDSCPCGSGLKFKKCHGKA